MLVVSAVRLVVQQVLRVESQGVKPVQNSVQV
jgi:hypothetical protein